MNKVGVRLRRGLLTAVLFGILGGIASDLTIGMILARNFNSAEGQFLQRIFLAGCPVLGFLGGIFIDPERISKHFGWICWGAVFGLGMLTIVTRLPIAFIPGADELMIPIPGTPNQILLEDVGFLSAPGALVLGGIFGWILSRQREREHAAKVPLAEETPAT